MLTGERLIPYWRLPPGAGLDLQALFLDPPDLDLSGLVQGWSLAPYARQGTVIDGTNFRMFERLVAGDAFLYMVILN